jgi:hypothetical protein
MILTHESSLTLVNIPERMASEIPMALYDARN